MWQRTMRHSNEIMSCIFGANVKWFTLPSSSRTVILGRHLRRILVSEFLVRPDRHLLRELLHIGSRDAVGRELRRHYVTVEESHRKQVWQAVLAPALR
jgi:hypothetical protein